MASSATDHLSKVNAFVSTAGNFIDSALDQLDDQLESAMGGMSEKVGEELRERVVSCVTERKRLNTDAQALMDDLSVEVVEGQTLL